MPPFLSLGLVLSLSILRKSNLLEPVTEGRLHLLTTVNQEYRPQILTHNSASHDQYLAPAG